MRALLFLLGILFFQSCLEVQDPYTAVPPGRYRAVLRLEPKMQAQIEETPSILVPEFSGLKFEEVANGELPFGMEVIYTSPTEFYVEFINGEERIRVDSVYFGRDRSIAKDSIHIKFPVYDSYISALTEGGVIEGDWVVNYRENYRIPFVAKYGENYRFTELRKEPVTDLTGRWAVTFEADSEDAYPAIGIFEQEGNKVTGTFRTETGDYRFLEGEIQADKLYLSVFDGSHAFLFEGKVNEQGIVGTFRSGKHYKTVWTAVRDSEATLTSPDSLTYLKPGFETVDFSFPLPDGTQLSPTDPKFAGKTKVIQILGTWCPNCRDETNFLRDYLKDHAEMELAVMGLAFERYRDEERAMTALRTYRQQMGIDYPIALGGYFNKKEAAEALPMLNHVLSYPTLIVLDANNRVRYIHTGFNGPATEEYENFATEFDRILRELASDS